MTTAAALSKPAPLYRSQHATPVAGVDVFHSMTDAERPWRALQAQNNYLTPFQRFEFLRAWQDGIGHGEGFQPLLVVAHDAHHQPLMLLPLVMRRSHGIVSAQFMGGKHTTYNMPLVRHDFVGSATKADLDTVLAGIRSDSAPVDVLVLERQPENWNELSNPMGMLSKQPSTNSCPILNIAPGSQPADLISNSFRRRLRGKERKLQANEGYRHYIPRTDAEIARILDAFFEIKPKRMAAQKLPDIFSDPKVENFVRNACAATLPSGKRAIEIHALECDSEVLAIFAGTADANHFSMMFNTYTTSENSKFSPGLILLRFIIDHYATKNAGSLDLGIGSDSYKLLFCKDHAGLFDSFIPLSRRGAMAATTMSSLASLKRHIKQNPALMQVVDKVRRTLHR